MSEPCIEMRSPVKSKYHSNIKIIAYKLWQEYGILYKLHSAKND